MDARTRCGSTSGRGRSVSRWAESSWTTLGGTSIGYVVLGYHYALLKLSGREGFNHPGLALIDFPITLADGATVEDKENFLIEPFVTLFRTRPTFQLVVCGRAFENLQGVHRVKLTTVWKQEEADGSVPPEELAAGEETGPVPSDAGGVEKADGPFKGRAGVLVRHAR